MAYQKNQLMKAVSAILIIVGVTGVVTFGAGFLMGAGIVDSHSTFKIAAELIHESLHRSASIVGVIHSDTEQTQAPTGDEHCGHVRQSYAGYSLVDLLRSQGTDSSLANRRKIAQENGLPGYQGTAVENAKLLAIVRGELSTDCAQ